MYEIEKRYLTGPSSRRPTALINQVLFMVSHDTGNPGSTAAGNVGYYENSRNEMSASAHTFIDDKQIIECIPLLTGRPEKAWQVVYNETVDNQMFGADANDAAGGVELCYGGAINLQEAYKRYVWYHAQACKKFGLNPKMHIVGHYLLDPKRRTDPLTPLKLLGKRFDDFTTDVEEELMREELEALKKDIAELKSLSSMPVPEWAKAAVSRAVELNLIDSPDGGSYDFYRTITILFRKGVI